MEIVYYYKSAGISSCVEDIRNCLFVITFTWCHFKFARAHLHVLEICLGGIGAT